ncbi:MAG: ATP-binding protein [Parafilimonas sp.]
MEVQSTEQLLLRIEELQNRLDEADQLIEAIKAGEVDAFAITYNNQSEVYTLHSGDHAYRVLIEEFGEGAVNLTEDGLIVYTNSYFFELIQLPYEKVVGSLIFDFIHIDSKQKFSQLFAQALQGKSKGEINLAVNNTIIPVYVSLTSLQPALNTVGMIITDLTEKKKMELERISNEKQLAIKNRELLNINRQLNEAKNFINNILESTNHGVLYYVAVRENNEVVDFEINYVNDIALEQINLPAEKVLGKRYLTVLPLAKKHGLLDRVVRVLETRVSETHEVSSPHDPNRWFMVHYAPLQDGITATFIEITEQKKQAKALQEKNLELERSNTELASFSYVASHDLQEPLRKIQTFSDRILDKEYENFSPAIKDYFQRIIAASKRMQNLISDLLNYSRTNTAEIVYAPTDLNIIVEEVKANLRELIEDSKAVFETSPLPTLNIVPLQFNQLFSNIIGNAIKYRKPGIHPLIKITAEIVPVSEIKVGAGFLNDKYWRIGVTDNGIGFEQEYAEKIFELFQRLHGKAEYEGTGIGLAICKKIIQNHRGFIKAVGQPGIGSTFNIYLPLNNIK